MVIYCDTVLHMEAVRLFDGRWLAFSLRMVNTPRCFSKARPLRITEFVAA